MPDLLAYQPSRSAAYYTPPSNYNLRRTIVGFLVAVVLVIIGAVAYAKIEPRMDHLMTRIGSAAVAGIAVGVIALIPIRVGRIRTPVLAAALGAVLAMIAIYVMWVVWVHDVVARFGAMTPSYFGMIRRPWGLWQVIRLINDLGTWSYKDDVMRGWPLAACWLGEAGMMLAAGVLMPTFSLFSDAPVCLTCGKKCTSAGTLPRFDADLQQEFLSAIENRDFAQLATHPPIEEEEHPELRLRLLRCDGCGGTNILTVSHIAWYVDANGTATVQTKTLIDKMLIAKDEAERLVAVCEKIEADRAAAEAVAAAAKQDDEAVDAPGDVGDNREQ